MTARFYSFVTLAMLVGLLFLWFTLQLPGGADVTTLIGPRTWPLAILVTMLSLVALMIVLLILRGPAQFITSDNDAIAPEAIVDDAVIRDEVRGTGWRHLAVLAVTVFYTIAMEFTGYLAATAIFAAIVNVILGERRPLRILLTVVVAMLIVAVLFDRLLNIPLP